MVSDRRALTLACVIMLSSLSSACVSTLEAKRNMDTGSQEVAAEDASPRTTDANAGLIAGEEEARPKADKGAHASARRPAASNGPLPIQTYDPAGKAIPYVASPNPYLNDKTPVATEAKAAFLNAQSALKRGDTKSARSLFLAMTKKYPELSGPWVQLASISESKGDTKDAINKYKMAIKVNPHNLNAYAALALLQRQSGQFIDAEGTYIDALNVWKDFPEAHLNLAVLYDLYINDPESAQKHYEAYYFLTGKKDEKVRKWLVEVKRRTGIEYSFIETPPTVNEQVANNATDAAVKADSTSKRK